MSKIDNKFATQMGWNFDNSYAHLPDLFYSKMKPTPVQNPMLVLFNESLAVELGLDPQKLQQLDGGVPVFAGNEIPEGAQPLAQAYAGHQFGHFTMLGDGRAILIGEQFTPHGERFDIQLKGSGRTPYSRGGDGRAALGPMLREYIISEAMRALGIPTTRSLAVVTTGEPVFREIELEGAILTRVASSHLRVGTFQYAARYGTENDLKSLADYAIQRHFPQIEESNRNSSKQKYLSLLEAVIRRQADLIAKWQLVGFIHGVMNTDNMTISGETIDYGPCAFMDVYDPATVFSSIDSYGRYAYGNQPQIAAWNLARFAEALLPLLHTEEAEAISIAEQAIESFPAIFHNSWQNGMRAKLGLFNPQAGDEDLIDDLLNLMEKYGADYTNTFRSLTLDLRDNGDLFTDEDFVKWEVRWQERRRGQVETIDASKQLMHSSNPAVIPRNHRVEEAIEAAVNDSDFSVTTKLVAVLANPYEHVAQGIEPFTSPSQSTQPYQTFCGT